MKCVEQIDLLGNKVIDVDQKINRKEEYFEILKELFDDVQLVNIDGKKIFETINDGKKYLIFTANITYLGHPHPTYKKRIQMPSWWKKIYQKNKSKYEIIFLGVYKFNDNYIFADFKIEDFINGKMNNSSAHIYTNDLYQAMVKKYHHRIDKNNNNINIIRKTYFKEYLLNRNKNLNKNSDEILSYIHKINHKIPFNTELFGIDCYDEMIKAEYSNMFQPEWPGFYLEYIYEKILNEDVPYKILTFNKDSKKEWELDFDLYSTEYNFYSDLKASDIKVTETPLNDESNVVEALDKYGKLWYIIYEHETTKDSEIENVVCKFWNSKQNELKNKNKSLTSYSKRMKGKVNFKKMFVLEVNRINSSDILKNFNQGKNSNGANRKAKFKIKKSDIENYIIYRYN